MMEKTWLIETTLGFGCCLFESKEAAENCIKTLQERGSFDPGEGVAVRVAVIPMRDQEEAA